MKNIKKSGIDYNVFTLKLLKKNFKGTCEKMNLPIERGLAIGDSLFGDIYGVKRNEMKMFFVKEVEKNEI